MADMAADHEQAAAADASDHAAALGSRIHGDMFANGVAGANFQARRLAMEFQILWRGADGSERINRGARAYGGAAVNHHMGFQNHALAEARLRAYHAIRTDTDAGP